MAGQRHPRHPTNDMYGTATTDDRTDTTSDLVSVSDRITRETALDCLLNTPHPLTVAAIITRTDTTEDAVQRHLDALVTAGIATRTDADTYEATWADLPLEELAGSTERGEVFRLEARDKEYREWFGVDDPYEATQPKTADTETAIVALDQWFGVRKRLHQLADDHPA